MPYDCASDELWTVLNGGALNTKPLFGILYSFPTVVLEFGLLHRWFYFPRPTDGGHPSRPRQPAATAVYGKKYKQVNLRERESDLFSHLVGSCKHVKAVAKSVNHIS
jgi:hypothetical protein